MSSSANDPILIFILTGVVTLTYFATRKMFGHDSREPPLAPQSIPIIGHILGLSRSKFNYYVDLRYTVTPFYLELYLIISQPADRLLHLYHVPPGSKDVRGDEA